MSTPRPTSRPASSPTRPCAARFTPPASSIAPSPASASSSTIAATTSAPAPARTSSPAPSPGCSNSAPSSSRSLVARRILLQLQLQRPARDPEPPRRLRHVAPAIREDAGHVFPLGAGQAGRRLGAGGQDRRAARRLLTKERGDDLVGVGGLAEIVVGTAVQGID